MSRIEDSFNAGERVFLAGASGEAKAFSSALFGVEKLDILTSFVPGINMLTADMIGPGSRVSNLFMSAAMAEAQRDGRFRHLPISYSAMVKWVREGPAFDACVVQVAPPDANGLCSLGPAAEFMPEVLKRSGRIVAVVNANVPGGRASPTLKLSDCAQTFEADAPLVTYDVGAVDADNGRIAESIAAFIGDGAAVQMGLGKVPHALMDALHDRRMLRIHSGMVSDGFMALADAGALDPNWQHVTTLVLGSQRLYGWFADQSDLRVRGTEYTHSPVVLSSIHDFVAVNSALEVDLFGQCNLELANGRAVSGAGGSSDFARAAKTAPGGVSIIGLPATFAGGKGSRIVARLGPDSIASLPRNDVDVVVTEVGAADLRGKSVHQRAEMLIGIAAPEFRATLTDQWEVIAARL